MRGIPNDPFGFAKAINWDVVDALEIDDNGQLILPGTDTDN